MKKLIYTIILYGFLQTFICHPQVIHAATWTYEDQEDAVEKKNSSRRVSRNAKDSARSDDPLSLETDKDKIRMEMEKRRRKQKSKRRD